MSTPQITLTALLQDISGVAAGTATEPAIVRIALAGFGLTLPCIVGTSNIVRTGPEDFYDSGTGVSIPLWGNDVINPLGTYYAITLLDSDGNILQTGAYQFSGSGATNLSSAPQVVPSSALIFSATTGDYPGHTYIAPGAVVAATYNGVLQRPGIDYTTSNAGKQINLTFETTDDPLENISAFCTIIVPSSLAPGPSMLRYVPVAPTPPQAAGTVYTAPGKIVGVAYNGVMQGSAYVTMISATTFSLEFDTYAGDTVYALCF